MSTAPTPATIVIAPPYRGARTARPPRPGRLALVCGGGLVRSAETLGLAEVLARHGIAPDLYVGASSGAMAAVLLSALGPEGAIAAASNFLGAGNRAWLRLLGRGPEGLLTFHPLGRWVAAAAGCDRLEDLPRTTAIATTDATTGASRGWCAGHLAPLVAASCTLRPAVAVRYPPAGPFSLIDAGYSANLPVSLAERLGASLTIAVDLITDRCSPIVAKALAAAAARGAGDEELEAPGPRRDLPSPLQLMLDAATRALAGKGRFLPDSVPDYWVVLGDRRETLFDLRAFPRLLERGRLAGEQLARALLHANHEIPTDGGGHSPRPLSLTTAA